MNIFQLLIQKFRKSSEEFSAVHSIHQVYQSSLINLPKYIFDMDNDYIIDIKKTNEILEQSNTTTGLTNIIIQISLNKGKNTKKVNWNLINIFADLGRYFVTVMSKDKNDIYISGSILDYINFFKYTRDYSNPYFKAIVKEINENVFPQPFKNLIDDEFMNPRKFIVSYEYDSEIKPIDLGNNIYIIDYTNCQKLYNQFFKNKLDAYEVGKLCKITIQFNKDFVINNPSLFHRFSRIAAYTYISLKLDVMTFTYTDLLEFLTNSKDILSDNTSIKLLYEILLEHALFNDENIFVPRYKLEQIQPENPDEILQEETKPIRKKKSTQEHRQIDNKTIQNNIESYIDNIDNPENNPLTKIDLDNFYDDDEEYDPENYF